MNAFDKFRKPQEEEKQPVANTASVAPIQATPAPAASQPLVITSEINAYINDRLKSQPKAWEEVKVIADESEERNTNALSLPQDINDVFKKRNISPRWINKDKQKIDRALDIRGWVLVNKVLFPELKTHHFTANGTIERGDSILGFMPTERAERLRREPGLKSDERVKNLPIDRWKNDASGEKYYKPSLSEEKDGEEITAGLQPDRKSEE